MTASTFTRSEVLTLAHTVRRASPSLTWSQCQKAAWSALRLRASLRTGAVRFTFTKEDGSTRQALGTLNSELFSYTSKTTDRADNPMVVKFYDLENQGFRSCRVDRLQAVAA